jgi:hypothetical protein
LAALLLDAGALVAVDRNDREMLIRLRAVEQEGWELRTTAIVVAQAWRDSSGRQVRLARLLQAVDVQPVDQQLGRRAGVLIGRADTSNPIDATLVLLSEDGDAILTSDPNDIRHLASVAGRRITVIPC